MREDIGVNCLGSPPGLSHRWRSCKRKKIRSCIFTSRLAEIRTFSCAALSEFAVCPTGLRSWFPEPMPHDLSRVETHTARDGVASKTVASRKIDSAGGKVKEGYHVSLPSSITPSSPRNTFKLVSTHSQGSCRLGSHSGVRRCRSWLSLASFAVMALITLVFFPKPSFSDPADVELSLDSSADGSTMTENPKRELLLAEPLYGSRVEFVSKRISDALASGVPISEAPKLAAKAAYEVAWTGCSRLCGGGQQLFARAEARSLAEEGIRRALEGTDELSETMVQAAGEHAVRAGLDQDASEANVKSRQCNTFKCPPDLPTDLRSMLLLLERDAESIESLGMIMQVGISEKCSGSLQLDQLGQVEWSNRRDQYRKVQSGGKTPGWEAFILAPEELNLFSCVSLCQLHRLCGAVMFIDDVETSKANQNEDYSSFMDQYSMDTPAAAAVTTPVVAALEKGVKGNRGMNNSVKSLEASESAHQAAKCILYRSIKLSLLPHCVEEFSGESLSLLVLDPQKDLKQTARSLRLAIELALEKSDAGVSDAITGDVNMKNGTRERLQTKPMKGSSGQTGESVPALVQVLSRAVKVVEEAALQAAEALSEAQSLGRSADELHGRKEESGKPHTDAFFRARPVSGSCMIYSGLQLLGKGCVEFPALQKLPHSDDSKSSNEEQPVGTAANSSKTASLSWETCLEALESSQKLFDEYRGLLSQIRDSHNNDEAAEKRLDELARLLLHVEAAGAARLSLSASIEKKLASTTVMSKESQEMLSEVEDLKNRRELLNRLGNAEGSLFGVFDTLKRTCEIVGMFEKRSTENGDSLGSQFPSACAKFNPSALLLLPSVTQRSTGTSDASGEKTTNKDESVCHDFPCEYSPWTSWSPCRGALSYKGAYDGDLKNKQSNSEEASQNHAVWQVRSRAPQTNFKLLRQCEAIVEARLCKDGEAKKSTTSQTKGFTEAIARRTTIWCVYSPYSQWGKCEPSCRRGDNVGSIPHRSRKRFVQQFPVVGLAPSCDSTQLFQRQICHKVAKCEEDQTSGDSNGGSLLEAADTAHVLSTKTHVNPMTASRKRYVDAKRHGILETNNELATHAETSRSNNPAFLSTRLEERGVDLGGSFEKQTENGAHTVATDTDETSEHKFTPETSSSLPNESKLSDVGATHVQEDGQFPRESSHLGGAEERGDKSSASGNATNMAPDSHDDDLSGTPNSQQNSGSISQRLGGSGNSDSSSTPSDDSIPFDVPSVAATGHGIEGHSGSSAPSDETGIPYDVPSLSVTGSGAPASNGQSMPNSGAINPSVEPSVGVTGAGALASNSSLASSNEVSVPFNPPSVSTTDNEADARKSETRNTDEATPAPQAAKSDAQEPEEFLFGLSFSGFVACCLCGAFACATAVLISVVCSKRIRSWLGHDWSGASEDEKKALLGKKSGLAPSPVVSPLVDPSGVKVTTPEGSPFLVKPCLNQSGIQHVTVGGAKIFVSMEGDFVDDWGKLIEVSDLPEELKAKVDTASRTNPDAAMSTAVAALGRAPMAQPLRNPASPPSPPDPNRSPIAKAISEGGVRKLSTNGSSPKAPSLTPIAGPGLPRAKVGVGAFGPPAGK